MLKKWGKRYGVTWIILMVGGYWGLNMLSAHSEIIPIEIVNLVPTIISCVILFMIVIPFLFGIVMIIKQGMHNLRECDDELFSEIDKFRKNWSKGKNNYLDYIRVINLYYMNEGKVDELVRNNEIEKLYARMNYLLNQTKLYDDMCTCFSSLMISGIASLVLQLDQEKNIVIYLCNLAIIIISFFAVILFKYMERGEAGTYISYAQEYERELLAKKIRNVEEKMKATPEDEIVLKGKRAILNELVHLELRTICKKRKDGIREDIETIEQLDLCLADYSECHIQKIDVKGKDAYLLYDKEKGVENNYIGEMHLKTLDYTILYQKLQKYNLLNYKK